MSRHLRALGSTGSRISRRTGLLHQGDHIASIPGTTKQHRFDENPGANDVALSVEELAFPDENLPVGAAADRHWFIRSPQSQSIPQ